MGVAREDVVGPATGGCVAGRYRVVGDVRALARGVLMARADDLVLRRPVLLKVVTGISPESAPLALGETRESDQRVALLFGEARLLARHSHPAVARVYDLGVAGGIAYVVQQWVDGPTLAELRRGSGAALSPSEATALVQQLCALPVSLLVGVHAGTVVLAPSGRPVLFGVSIAHDIASQLVGAHGEDAVQAMAVLLHELLGGRGAGTDGVAGATADLSRLNPAVPAELAAVVERALSAGAPSFFPDVLGFALALAPFAGGTREERRTPRPWPRLSAEATAGAGRRPERRLGALRAVWVALGMSGLLGAAVSLRPVQSPPAAHAPARPAQALRVAQIPASAAWRPAMMVYRGTARRPAPAGIVQAR